MKELLKKDPWYLMYVPTKYKTQQLYKRTVEKNLCIPDCYGTQEISGKSVKRSKYALKYVPRQYKTKKMC